MPEGNDIHAVFNAFFENSHNVSNASSVAAAAAYCVYSSSNIKKDVKWKLDALFHKNSADLELLHNNSPQQQRNHNDVSVRVSLMTHGVVGKRWYMFFRRSVVVCVQDQPHNQQNTTTSDITFGVVIQFGLEGIVQVHKQDFPMEQHQHHYNDHIMFKCSSDDPSMNFAILFANLSKQYGSVSVFELTDQRDVDMIETSFESFVYNRSSSSQSIYESMNAPPQCSSSSSSDHHNRYIISFDGRNIIDPCNVRYSAEVMKQMVHTYLVALMKRNKKRKVSSSSSSKVSRSKKIVNILVEAQPKLWFERDNYHNSGSAVASGSSLNKKRKRSDNNISDSSSSSSSIISNIVGIGNYLICEIFYDARINPNLTCDQLNEEICKKLSNSIVDVCRNNTLHIIRKIKDDEYDRQQQYDKESTDYTTDDIDGNSFGIELKRLKDKIVSQQQQQNHSIYDHRNNRGDDIAKVYKKEYDDANHYEILADKTIRTDKRTFYWCPNHCC